MKKDIILSGVGGQGILSIATVIGKAALKDGLYMKQAEVHGMSQRGGDVQSNLRISDQPIASDLIPSGKCDLIISLEPMEGLRYLPYLGHEGWLVTNETPFVNIPNYPAESDVMAEINKLPHKVVLNVDKVAKELVDVLEAMQSIMPSSRRSSYANTTHSPAPQPLFEEKVTLKSLNEKVENIYNLLKLIGSAVLKEGLKDESKEK